MKHVVHCKRAPFFAQVARLEVEWFESRAAALEQEAALIRDHQPRYNQVGAAERHRPPLELVCDRCGTSYLETPEWGWVLGGTCDDTPYRKPCGGRLREAP